ncbi:hypothetical protein [Streptomyces sp. NPDC000229]|uniref:hypothetical protein n=1 Tax=Streptomyces sp. NPDC000229 TaxID=3154247 RepID=UPI00332A5526
MNIPVKGMFDHRILGQATPMPCVQSDLASRVRHALSQAGFHLVGGVADDNGPGLRVTEAPAGVLITWTASHGFASLAAGQPRASGDSMKAVVQAAVAGLLLQMGYTVTEAPDDAGLLVTEETSQ